MNPQGQFFHCFGCGESGDVFSFVMKYHNLRFPEALKQLADRYHIDLPEPRLSAADQARIRHRQELFAINEQASRIFAQYLNEAPQAEEARKYLNNRGVPSEKRDSFRLGYAPEPRQGGWDFLLRQLIRQGFPRERILEAGLATRKDRGRPYDRFRDRILFPIWDASGRVVAFGGRALHDSGPKYLNSPESPIFNKSRILYGFYQHRQGIRQARQALVVEGNFDLLLLAIHGLDNVVAPLGTALTRHHVRLLRGLADEVVLLFDGDAAGLKAAFRSVPFFLAEQQEARVALLPQGHDPDSLIRATGVKGVHDLIKQAMPLAEFLVNSLVQAHGLTLDGKNRIIATLRELMKEAPPSQRQLMTAHFAEQLGVTPALFAGPRRRSPQQRQRKRSGDPAQSTLAGLPLRWRQLADFLILFPEYFHRLQAGGLGEIVDNTTLAELCNHLEDLTAHGTMTPDQLLSRLANEGDRNYVARLLMEAPGLSGDDQEPAQTCRELQRWITLMRQKRRTATLLEKIAQAQHEGNTGLLMELLQEKQKTDQKIIESKNDTLIDE